MGHHLGGDHQGDDCARRHNGRRPWSWRPWWWPWWGRRWRAPAAPAATPLSDAIAALQALVDAKAPAADIKTAIAKVEGLRNDNQAALVKAQGELRGLLKAVQEGYLVCQGVL